MFCDNMDVEYRKQGGKKTCTVQVTNTAVPEPEVSIHRITGFLDFSVVFSIF
jgi:hypothetical protein